MADDQKKLQKHRSITQRIVIAGTLRLESPASFGNGDADALTDMPLLMDESTGQPLLLGTSLAGALRNYLREVELGYEVTLPENMPNATDVQEAEVKKAKKREIASKAVLLFGGYRGDDDGKQSPLIVHDADGKARAIEFRDGVAIDARTRTATDDKKFDMQLLAAGSTFALRFELIVREDGLSEDDLLAVLATALHGLAQGEITLGGRKRRGLGTCSVTGWQVRRYPMNSREAMLAWLASEREKPDAWCKPVAVQADASIWKALGIHEKAMPDKRDGLTLSATFRLKQSLLIRSGFSEADQGPDVVHLHSLRPGQTDAPGVTPGTSWAGVLRARACKIAATLGAADTTLKRFVNGMFGPDEITANDSRDDNPAKASHLTVRETIVEGGLSRIQNRIKINRFTGGAFDTALFEEQPMFGDSDTRVHLDLHLRNPREAEIGLLLLLLKDAWVGDLPLGGGSAMGRGVLQGLTADLRYGGAVWKFTRGEGDTLQLTGTDGLSLQRYVDAFGEEMAK